MRYEKKFWDLYVAGEVDRMDLFDYIHDWNEANTDEEVYTWLSCSEEQYAVLIRYPEHAEDIRVNNDPAYALALLHSLQSWKE